MSRSGLLPALAIAATALTCAQAGARDARLASKLYNANEIVTIEGRAGVQATIVFGNEEHIENVAIGDSGSWQVTPNKRANILFVKPLHARVRTNLTVITDQHSYFFDLVASPTAQALYSLRFSYPEMPKPVTPPATPSATQSHQDGPPADRPHLNFAWRVKGAPALAPSRIYDDGAALYLTWPADARLPAILVHNQKGEEGPVNFTVRGGVIVIDNLPEQVVLRSGKDSALLEPELPVSGRRPIGAPAATAAPQSQGS